MITSILWYVVLVIQTIGLEGNQECALLLKKNLQSTSHLGYVFNAITPYSAGLGDVCITYSSVNQAFHQALSKTTVVPPDGDWEPEDIAPLGEVLLDTAATLSQLYGLSRHDIWKSLPKLDVSKTAIAGYCPDYASPMTCVPGKYRRTDGLCNNLKNPTWGATRATFERLLLPAYSDGIGSPKTQGHAGGYLPEPRHVSALLHKDEGFHDHAATLLLVAWGQFMDHDFTLTATPLDSLTRNEFEDCCHLPPALKHPLCMEINIPKDDAFYKLFNQDCMDFVRAFTGVRQDCKLGPRAPFNILPGVIDGNTVYSATETHANKIRSHVGGLLKGNHHFQHLGLKELMPAKTDVPEEGCTRFSQNQFCFEGGEIRVNENLILTTIHTLMFREHNRICRQLNEINPHWDDEKVYQETRRIVIAEIQHITYDEFLPQLLGSEVMTQYGLHLQKEGYWNNYDPYTNPSMTVAFITAAFRFGHTLLPSTVERRSVSHKYIKSRRLSKLIRQPWDLYEPGVLDEYYMGLMHQPAQAFDDSITQEVTNHLFEEPGEHFGVDLISFNLQRGREAGLPSYTAYRNLCGLPKINSFYDLAQHMTNSTAHKYAQLYSSVDDIDLFSGGVSERPQPGSLLGPTFTCIIALQFQRLRKGDRYWYELPDQPSSFTPRQLSALRKVRLSRLLCENTDRITTLQTYLMVLPDHNLNPRVSCQGGVLPHLDLSAWREQPEYPPSHVRGEHRAPKSHFLPFYSLLNTLF